MTPAFQSSPAPGDRLAGDRSARAEPILPSEDPMTNPNLDLEALLAACEAAMKGPWFADAAFITLAQPSTVKALVSRLQASEAEVERSEKHRNDLADKIVSQQTTLYAQAKAVDLWKERFDAMFGRATTAEAALTQRDEVIRGLREALEPFADMADAMDDAEDLIDDEDRKGHANLSFGGMTMGDWDRDDFRRAQAALTASRTPPEKGEG